MEIAAQACDIGARAENITDREIEDLIGDALAYVRGSAVS
jgi:hypothetical protein